VQSRLEETRGITFEDFCRVFIFPLDMTRWGSIHIINRGESGLRVVAGRLKKL
jgi:hypothetical protein